MNGIINIRVVVQKQEHGTKSVKSICIEDQATFKWIHLNVTCVRVCLPTCLPACFCIFIVHTEVTSHTRPQKSCGRRSVWFWPPPSPNTKNPLLSIAPYRQSYYEKNYPFQIKKKKETEL